jgi:hypothetical protein
MKCTMLFSLGLVFFAVTFPASSWADNPQCDCSKRYEALSAPSQQALQQGMLVSEVNKNTASEYHMGYVYTLAEHPPEVVTAVFINYKAQKGSITNVLAAHVEEQSANYVRVRFVYDLPWPLPNSEYVVNDTVVQEGETYLLYWNLHPSSPAGISAPRYVEGYFRTQPVGARTLIIYCNYVIPAHGLFPGKVNSDGLKAMQTTLHDTIRWVDAIAAAPEASNNILKGSGQCLPDRSPGSSGGSTLRELGREL